MRFEERPCPHCGSQGTVGISEVASDVSAYPSRGEPLSFTCPYGCQFTVAELASAFPDLMWSTGTGHSSRE